MIFCPICGTANRHGSKFCNECGIKFEPQTQAKCPTCGTLNAVEAVACTVCGERLSSSSTPGPDSIELPAQGEASELAPPKPAAGVPAWFQELPSTEGEEIPQVSGTAAQGESPARQAGRQQPAEEPALPSVAGTSHDLPPVEDTFAESASILAGIQGTLQAEEIITQPRVPVADTPDHRESDSQEAGAMASQARLFAEIVAPPPVATPQTIAQPKRHLLTLLPRWIIYAVLIAVVTLPLLMEESYLSLLQKAWPQNPYLPVNRTAEATPAVASLYEMIESLDSDAPVLVAFDYDPTTIDEMDILARAVVSHLMDRESRLVAISLLPAGAATAQSLLESTAAGQPGYSDGYGQRYANLGYLPGQAAAVRLLGQSIETALPSDFQGNRVADLDVMEGITSVASFDLIVEFAAAQNTLRWWVEQASMPYDVPLGAAVSASQVPLVRPYYETDPRQLVGLVGGVPGAVMYEALRSGYHLADNPRGTVASQEGPEGTMTARLDSQLAGHLVLVVVIIIGNGVYLVRRAIGKEH